MSPIRIACVAGAFFVLCCVQPVNGQEDAPPVRVVEYAYSFVRPPFIHPKIIQDLSTWLSDRGRPSRGDQPQRCPREQPVLRRCGRQCYRWAMPLCVHRKRKPAIQLSVHWHDPIPACMCSTRLIGETVRGVFTQLMLLAIEFDYGIDCCDWDAQTRYGLTENAC